jgi:hypothetical protein
MSRAIPKPTTKTRKRGAALTVSDVSKKGTASFAKPFGTIGHSGHGIAGLAKELADLKRLSTMPANAEGPIERAREAKDVENMAHATLCAVERYVENAAKRSYAMVCSLEQVILTLEPTTAGETLSLALIALEELDVFVCNYVKADTPDIQSSKRQLLDAFEAVIRGLYHGAGAMSPLIEHYASKDLLQPWAEERAEAELEAGPYLTKEALDQ